jgi:hypothetical protein
MTLRTLTAAAAVAAVLSMGLAGCASAAGDAPHARASIPFAALGGIKDWTAPNNRTLLVQAENGTWYRADLMGECLNLTTSNTVAFVTDPDYALTKFGSIIVDGGQRCWFKSFEKTTPPPKAGQHKAK